MTDAVNKVLRAWRVAGPNPEFHEAAKKRLKREWPSLYAALDELDRRAHD